MAALLPPAVLLASALAAFDQQRLANWEIVLRLAGAALVLHFDVAVYASASAAAIGWLVFHHLRGRKLTHGGKPA